MGDLARHQELQRILGAGIVTEVDQSLVHDLGAGFDRNVAAQVNVEFAGDLQIVGCPWVALRIEQVHPAAARDRNQGISLGGLAVEFRGFQMHPRQQPDDLQMAQLLCADIHQQVFAVGILAIQALD
jgi:hypothetical protein